MIDKEILKDAIKESKPFVIRTLEMCLAGVGIYGIIELMFEVNLWFGLLLLPFMWIIIIVTIYRNSKTRGNV